MEAFLETISKGRWQWQSNPNPWDKKEMPQWEPYPLEQDYLIEKAYYDQKKEVDLGEWIISIKHMIQKKKGDVVSQRPVRRISGVDHPEEIDRSERYIETEVPKTMNRIFGSLGDFVSFFSRRNPDILGFTNHFKELEKSNDFNRLNSKIAPKLVECLQEVLLKPNEEQLKDSSLSQFKKKKLLKVKERIQELICLFQREFSSFEEFYGHILMAYTMNTELYPILNDTLRNENWIEVDKLLPYAFCLCKAFFNLNLKTGSDQDGQIFELQTPFSRLLYRGTAFDDLTLGLYNKDKVQNFSWHSVTSTSTSKRIAEEFMYKTVDMANKKYPVMFIIEIPPETEFESEYLKFINIRQYSAIPKEDEVVLPPGSVFELLEVLTDQDKKTTIKIKLRNEIKSLAHGGMMMQGALQSQMMTEKEAKIMCLEGDEVYRALMSLCGNKLIEEVELCLCTFNKKSLSKMFEVLSTLEKARELKFIACTYEDNGEILSKEGQEGERCFATKIEIIEANDFLKIILNERPNQEYWRSLKKLDFDFRSLWDATGEELCCTVSQWLKYLPHLKHLSLNFELCKQMTDKGVECLTKGLISFTQLTYLNLNFGFCKQITSQGVNILAQRLDPLTQLTHLNLRFSGCDEITDEGMNSFAKSLNSLTQLVHLNLNFRSCFQITDEGMNSLAKSLNSLSQLTHFEFHFIWWTEIKYKGISSLVRLLDPLTHLTHLNLGFSWCQEISEEDINCLVKGLGSLTKLTDLNLNFEGCTQIVDQYVNHLAKELGFLKKLTHLNLNFWQCKQITDDGVNSLAKGMSFLTQLTHLHLRFAECFQITNRGVSHLMSQGLQNLTRLTFLILDFSSCQQITDRDLHILAEKWLKPLISLKSPIVKNQRIQNIDPPPKHAFDSSRVKLAREKSLEEKDTFYEEASPVQMAPFIFELLEQAAKLLVRDLFDSTVSIGEENQDMSETTLTLTFSDFCSGIGHLNSLTLNFKWYNGMITDVFIRKLSSQVLRNLPQLKSLTLIFQNCHQITGHQITDKGVRYLAYGLKPLKNLTSLNLDFFRCGSITDKGVDDLILEGLNHLSQLKFLALNFNRCEKITDEELLSLASHGFRHISQLEALALSASITDKGIDCFISHDLQCLTQLKFLGLDFFCSGITDRGMNNLILGIVKNLTKLTSLDLDFFQCNNISDSTVHNIFKVLHYFGFTKEVSGKTLLDCGREDHSSFLISLSKYFYEFRLKFSS